MVLEPDDLLTFGKYKGKKVLEVFFENSQYLQWAEQNVKDFVVNWSPLIRIHKEIMNCNSDEPQVDTHEGGST